MHKQSTSKLMLSLFSANFVTFFVGSGLLPILPLYATRFGATPTVIGLYLAFTYLAITVGTLLAGWLTQHLSHKHLFLASGVVGIPALLLLGQANSLWQVVILTAAIWFCGGVGTALVSVFTGLYTNRNNRGTSFGLMSLARPLGALLSGMMVGHLIEHQGYAFMFAVLGIIWISWPVTALFGLKRAAPPVPARAARKTATAPSPLGATFHLLLLVSLLSAMTVYISKLGMSLSMHALHFSPSAISSTTTISGLVTIPVVFGLSALSDRLGRKRLLTIVFLIGAASAVLLSVAHTLWHFWLATILILVSQTASGALALAFATDLLPPETLSGGLSRLNAMPWIAGILGFASTGFLMDTLGATMLYGTAAALSLIAIGLLGTISREQGISPTPPHGIGVPTNA